MRDRAGEHDRERREHDGDEAAHRDEEAAHDEARPLGEGPLGEGPLGFEAPGAAAPHRPLVAVVVPTHDRPDGLTALLDALRGQTLDPDRFEVVVVDDGSRRPVSPLPSGFALRVLRHERARGPAAARNTGWRATRAPIVAFVDDDCMPVPGWLSALVDAAGNDGDVVVQGPVEPPSHQRHEVRPLSHTVELAGPSPLFVTCNIAYTRTLLERLGGLDEAFRHACGEDVDLGMRAMKAGAGARFARGALVHHEVRQPDLRRLVAQAIRWEDAVRVLRLHPELRRSLVAGVFWKPSHPPLLLAALGVASRRPAVAALAALPYLELYRRTYRGRLGLGARELPRHLVVDAVEVASMVRGSVRHRTLML